MQGVPQQTTGLVRSISRWSLAALMINTMVGGGIFGLPSAVAEHLGKSAPLAYLIAGAGIAVIAACMGEVASQFQETGGPYLYARAALGRYAGILIAWMTWLSRIAAASATGILFTTYLGQLAPRAGEPWIRTCILTLLIGVLAAINYRGVRSGARVSDFFTSFKVLLLSLFIVAGLASLFWKPATAVIPLTHPIRAEDWFEAVLVLVYAYGGFEAALFASGETRDARRDAPAALLIAIAAVTVIYTLVQVVVDATLRNPAATERPLAESARQVFGESAGIFIAIGALVSIYGYLSANMLHTPRLTYALAERGDFPEIFAAVHPRFRTPYVSILVFTALLLVFTLAGNFRWNATLSAIARLFTYGSVAVAVLVLRRKRPNADAFRLPAGRLFAALGVAFSAVLLLKTPRSNLKVVGATIAIATLNWVAVRRRDRASALPRS